MRSLLVMLAFLYAYNLYGQYGLDGNEPETKWHIEGYFNLGVPIADFGDNLEQNGFGGGGSFLYNLQGPIWMGITGNGARYDNYGITYLEQGDGELFEVEEITATRIARVYATFRFEPLRETLFSPYVEGGIGWHWIFTNTKLTDIEFDEQIDRFSEIKDNRIGFGLYGGVRLSPNVVPSIGLELRVGYVYNAQVEYMRYNPDIPVDPGAFPVEAFEIRESPVDVVSIDIGVSFRF